MKIVKASQLAAVEKKAIELGSSAREFMQQAGYEAFQKIYRLIKHLKPDQILILCGKGNNGGDGFVIGSHLLDAGFNVTAVLPEERENCSPLAQEMAQIFAAKGGKLTAQFPPSKKYLLIVDAIFGSGFKGDVKAPYFELIASANEAKAVKVSVDIASGLSGDDGSVANIAFQADITITLGLAKVGHFLNSGPKYSGRLKIVDFGLPKKYISELDSNFSLLTQAAVKTFLPKIAYNRHKYQAGTIFAVAGSTEMSGAAILSSYAALKAGSGLVKLFYPKNSRAEFVNCPVEIIKQGFNFSEASCLAQKLNEAKAVFIGPGMGRTEEVEKFLNKLIPLVEPPLVLDADALFFLAKKSFKAPRDTVITPHLGEMKRLLNITEKVAIDMTFLQKCQNFAHEHSLNLVLKGCPTFIFGANCEKISVCHRGDPGMATAGAGDVLTGIISSLLSQGLQPIKAAKLGAYLHGIAGEIAAQRKTAFAMTASDLIENIYKAYTKFISLK